MAITIIHMVTMGKLNKKIVHLIKISMVRLENQLFLGFQLNRFVLCHNHNSYEIFCLLYVFNDATAKWLMCDPQTEQLQQTTKSREKIVPFFNDIYDLSRIIRLLNCSLNYLKPKTFSMGHIIQKLKLCSVHSTHFYGSFDSIKE